MTGLVQRAGSDDRHLVLRSPSGLATRALSAQVSIIHLYFPLQDVSLLSRTHGPQNLVMQQPGRVVGHTQVTAQLQRGDARFGLANQVERQEPGGQRQFCRLHDRARRDSGLVAALPALVALEPAASYQPMISGVAARATEAFWPARLLQSGLT